MTVYETARDLLFFAGGPSIVGVWALIGFVVSTLSSDKRIPRKGWLALWAGLLLVSWLVLFIALATDTVIASWTSGSGLQPILVLLSANWIVAMIMLVVLILNGKAVFRYIVRAHHRGDDRSRTVRLLRRWLKE